MLRLEQLRKEKGLSQEELAIQTNLTQQRISSYEKEKREPDIDTLNQLADYFGCSIDYLIGKSDIRTPIDLSQIQFANAGGLNTDGLTERDIEELKAQIEFKRKYNKERKNEGKN